MKNLIFILIILNISILFSLELPFTYQRIGVDFEGAAFNQSSILAYGTGSIVLRSSDGGKSWEQIQVADDSLTIKEIKNYNGIYLGVLDKDFIIKSVDNGLTWQAKQIDNNQNLYDIDANSSNIYILKDETIEILDFDLNKTGSIDIDTSFHSRELFIHENMIYLPSDSGKIVTVDIDDNYNSSFIDFKSLNLCIDCKKLSRMKASISDIYVSSGRNLYKSTNKGKDWAAINTEFIMYNVFEKDLFDFNVLGHNEFFMCLPTLYKLNINGLQIVTIDSMKRYAMNLLIKDYSFICKDTIIVVGMYKTIIMSYDGGITWNFISNKQGGGAGDRLDDLTQFTCNNDGQVFKTTNGGVTWLPQKYTDPLVKKFYQSDFCHFEKSGKGFFYKQQVDSYANNLLISYDSGETYQQRYIREMANYRFNSVSLPMNCLDSVYYFFSTYIDQKNYYSKIFIYDTSFKFIKSKRIDSIQIVEVNKWKDKLIALGYERKYPDSTGFDSVNCYIMYSDDGGWNWYKDFKMNTGDTNLYQLNIFEDFLLIGAYYYPTHVRNYNYLYKVDLIEKKHYLLIAEDTLSDFLKFAKFGDWIYCGGNRMMYYCEDIVGNPYKWEKLPFVKYYTSGMWVNEKNTFAYVGATNKATRQSYTLKFILKKPTEVIESPQIETTQFWALPPYPIPAKNIVKSTIYWDMKYDINKDDIAVFNIYGAKIEGKENITIDILQPYSGDLIWDCSSQSSGIYFIRILHGDYTKVIPVMIDK